MLTNAFTLTLTDYSSDFLRRGVMSSVARSCLGARVNLSRLVIDSCGSIHFPLLCARNLRVLRANRSYTVGDNTASLGGFTVSR